MKKRNILIIIVLLLIIIVLISFKVFMIKETKNDMLTISEDLFNSIDKDYKIIKDNIKKEDGSDLSNAEIENLLLNTELYRTLFTDDETFTYITNVNFFNTKTGNITISFETVKGDTISSTFKYFRQGTTSYLIATDNIIKDSNKEKEKYYLDTDLKNDEELNFYEDSNEKNTNIGYEVLHIDSENNKLFIEILKEAKDDIIYATEKHLTDEIKKLKNINENYKVDYNDDYTVFSIYYDEATNNKIIAQTLKTRILYFSIISQALDNKEDWHLTINYYNYKNNTLLKTETIR